MWVSAWLEVFCVSSLPRYTLQHLVSARGCLAALTWVTCKRTFSRCR